MRLDADDDVRVARRPAARPFVSLPGTRMRSPSSMPGGIRVFTFSVTVARPPGAGDGPGDADLDRRPVDRVGERKAHLELEILTAPRAPAGPPPPSASSEQLEDVGEVSEPQVFEVDRGPLKRIEAGLEGFVTAAVVFGSLLGRREHGERFRDFLELRFGRFVAGVDVRVVLARELAIGRFEVFLGGRLETPRMS